MDSEDKERFALVAAWLSSEPEAVIDVHEYECSAEHVALYLNTRAERLYMLTMVSRQYLETYKDSGFEVKDECLEHCDAIEPEAIERALTAWLVRVLPDVRVASVFAFRYNT